MSLVIPSISFSRSINVIVDQDFEMHGAQSVLTIYHVFNRRRPHIVWGQSHIIFMLHALRVIASTQTVGDVTLSYISTQKQRKTLILYLVKPWRVKVLNFYMFMIWFGWDSWADRWLSWWVLWTFWDSLPCRGHNDVLFHVESGTQIWVYKANSSGEKVCIY